MRYIIKNKANWYAIFNLLLLLLIPILIVGVFIALSFASNTPIYELSIFEFISLLIVIAFGLFIVNWIVWQLNGYEEVTLDEMELFIQRKGKLVNEKFRIKTAIIQTIEEHEYMPITFGSRILRNPFLFSKLIGESGGRIIVKYGINKMNKVVFGLGLTPEEARAIVKDMNVFLSENFEQQLKKKA
jgi:flagellar biosynthesis protein FliQ